MSQRDETAPYHEPLLNAPWTSVVVVLTILTSYAWQTTWGGGDAAAQHLGFAPADLDRGRWLTTITVVLVHGGWAHAIINAVAALAFGAPVARLLGTSPRGAAAFFGFFLACAVLSSLGYAALHLHDPQRVIGASGAVSGLMGAAARLIGREDQLSPVLDRPVLNLAMGLGAANVLMAVFGATPFMPGARVAWEAHAAGFLAGLLLIGPFLSISRSAASR